MASRNDDLPWPPPAGRRPPVREALLSPPTQIVRDRDDYLGQAGNEIGRRIADDQVELFVSTDPAEALQQQMQRLVPEYIAMHDVGTSAGVHLLNALAGAAGAPVQNLTIRRQGQGVALAVLSFVEVPVAEGLALRVYSTDANADPATRQNLALVLLAHARLGALLVGDLQPHALTQALQPLRDALARGAWPNRDMLMLPLGGAGALAAQAAQLAGGSGVSVRVTPQAARAADAWSFISGTWNRLHGVTGEARLETDIQRAVPRPAVPLPQAPTQPMDLQPMPAPPPPPAPRPAPPPVARAVPAPPPAPSPWDDYADRCAAVRGVLAGCVFELASLRVLAHTGRLPPEALAVQGRRLLESLTAGTHELGLGSGLPEAAITLGQEHLILRPVAGHHGVVLLLVLHASASNLTLARMQLERVTPPQ